MGEFIGYCEEKKGPTYQHPEYSGDVLCGECLIAWWDEDIERYLSELKDSIEETGLESDTLNELKQKEMV